MLSYHRYGTRVRKTKDMGDWVAWHPLTKQEMEMHPNNTFPQKKIVYALKTTINGKQTVGRQ